MDDRAAEDPVTAVARLSRELEDLKSTVMARVARRPTGDTEWTIRATPKPDTLFMQGQLVLRATYPALWQWVLDNGALTAGLFGPGDGTTNFGLPNMAGRIPVGVGTLGADTYVLGQELGAARVTIAAANLPVHDHGTHGNHGHNDSGFTNTVGDHGGHVDGGNANHPTGGGYLHGHPPSWGFGDGGHNHTVDTGFPASAGGHNAFGAASPTAIDLRQPVKGVNWMIWT